MSSAPPDPINEVRELIDAGLNHCMPPASPDEIARALAEAGWLRTAEDRAVLDRLAEQIASMEDIQRNMPSGLTETGRGDLMTAYYIRDGVWRLVERRAVGGSVPADPEGTA